LIGTPESIYSSIFRGEPIPVHQKGEERMLKTDWVEKAEFRIEALRKAAENELYTIERDFPNWSKDDARRCAIMRLASILFVPVVSLYTMRVHMCDPAWWELYAPGAGSTLADEGRTAFNKGIRGNLIVDLVGNLEHSFRLILNQLDPANKASKFSTIYQGLFRATNPHLTNVPADCEPTMKLLRLIRNTIHTSWTYFPDNGKDETITFKGASYQFVVGRPLDFISWDLVGEISESVLQIVIGVVRDTNVVRLPPIKDFGVEIAKRAAHEKPI